MRTSRQKGKDRVSLLSLAKRAEIVSHLCEGAGIRPASRLTNTSPTTILSLLLKVGKGCDRNAKGGKTVNYARDQSSK
jgi:hypothetical protein